MDSVYQVIYIHSFIFRVLLISEYDLYSKRHALVVIFSLPFSRSIWKLATREMIQDDPAQSQIFQSYESPNTVDSKRQIRENKLSESSFPDISSGVSGVSWVYA